MDEARSTAISNGWPDFAPHESALPSPVRYTIQHNIARRYSLGEANKHDHSNMKPFQPPITPYSDMLVLGGSTEDLFLLDENASNNNVQGES